MDYILSNPDIFIPGCRISIHSDSQSALKALMARRTSSLLIWECVQSLIQASNLYYIELNWIKSHVQHIGNLKADDCAKYGTLMVTHNVEPMVPIAANVYKNLIRKSMLTQWKLYWQNLPECRQTKIFFPEPAHWKTKFLLNLDRPLLGRILRYCLGHNFLSRHNYLLSYGSTITPNCRFCDEDVETSWHIICQCSSFNDLRMKHFKRHIMNETNPHWEPYQLVGFLSEQRIVDLEEQGTTLEDQIDDSDEILGNNPNQQ